MFSLLFCNVHVERYDRMIAMEEQVPNVGFLLRIWEVPDSITGSYSDSPKVSLY